MSRMGEIIRIDNNNPSVETVKLTLHDALTDIANGRIRPTKVLIILIDDSTVDPETGVADYHISQYNGGMSCSQCIAALEIIKTRFLKIMGFL